MSRCSPAVGSEILSFSVCRLAGNRHRVGCETHSHNVRVRRDRALGVLVEIVNAVARRALKIAARVPARGGHTRMMVIFGQFLCNLPLDKVALICSYFAHQCG